MKKSILVYLSFFLLLTITSFAQHNPNRLLAIPTPPHNFEIEVYFPGATPKRPNLKIEILEAFTDSEMTYGNLIKRLQAQAQKVGADAIVLMERERNSYFDAEFGIYRVTNYLSAVAIKYIENINYLHQYKKEEKAYTYDKEKGIYVPFSKVHYSLMGTIDSTQGEQTLHSRINERSTHHLIFEKNKHWNSYLGNKGYQIRSFKNGVKRAYIVQRAYPMIHFKVRGVHDWATITIKRNKADQEEERIIEFEDSMERERYFYDTEGRLWKIEVSKKLKNQEELPYFKIEFEFYKNENLQTIIKRMQEPFFFKNRKD